MSAHAETSPSMSKWLQVTAFAILSGLHPARSALNTVSVDVSPRRCTGVLPSL